MGRTKSLELQAIDLLRRIKLQVLNGMVKTLTVSCWQELGLYLLNERRSDLMQLEKLHNTKIQIQFKPEYNAPAHFDIIKRSKDEEKEEMVMPPPLSLSTMAASMSEQAINEQKDYREEKLEALEKLTFEELRSVDIPIPQSLTPFDRFNFSVRVMLMKRHGLYEKQMGEFKDAIREKVMKGTASKVDPDETSRAESEEEGPGISTGNTSSKVSDPSSDKMERTPPAAKRGGASRSRSTRPRGNRRPISKTREMLESRSKDV